MIIDRLFHFCSPHAGMESICNNIRPDCIPDKFADAMRVVNVRTHVNINFAESQGIKCMFSGNLS